MDGKRKRHTAYEYLCHLEEAKKWMETCLGEELPVTTELEQNLCNGVYLAKLATFFLSKVGKASEKSYRKIYDINQTIYKTKGLRFRHTDNINYWIVAMESIGMSTSVLPEITDVYEHKNMPKVIFCLHALSLFLYNLGVAPKIQNLLGKIVFTEDELCTTDKKLFKSGIQLPHFENISFASKVLLDGATYTLKQAVEAVNQSLENGSIMETLKALKLVELNLPSVLDFAAALYYEEFSVIRKENQADLTYEEIKGGVIVLTAVAKINLAIVAENVDATFTCISDESARIFHINEDYKLFYHLALSKAKKHKIGTVGLLTHFDIQKCIDDVNCMVQEDNIGLFAVNAALQSDKCSLTVDVLVHPAAGFSNIYKEHYFLYHNMLKNLFLKKVITIQDSDGYVGLSVEEVKDNIENANKLHPMAFCYCLALAQINSALQCSDVRTFMLSLQNPDSRLSNVLPSCGELYKAQMLKLIEKKTLRFGLEGRKLVQYETPEGISFYMDLETMKGIWQTTESEQLYSISLSKEEIQAIVSSINSKYEQLVLLQATIRGFIFRQQFMERLNFLNMQDKAVQVIQAYWKGFLQRRAYNGRKNFFRNCYAAVIVIQSLVRMYLVRRKYRRRLNYLKNQVAAVTMIQTFWRGYQTRKALRVLMCTSNPPFSVVQKFVHILNLRHQDFSEELEFYRMQEEVVKAIKHNQKLEKDLTSMDVKIGLLIKNRITLQDVLVHGKRLDNVAKQKEELESSSEICQSIMALSKESHVKLEAYQNLFYTLQANPEYLSKLIFLQLPGKNKFIESFILKLFNFASNEREEYLLLKLLKTVLQEEIQHRVNHPNEIVTSNLLIVKLIIGLYRNKDGHCSLKEILGPLVKHVLDDTNLYIATNPVEVYKAYVNQLETTSGQPCGFPYNVTQEEALQYEEVRKRIQASVTDLKEKVLMFFDAIVKSLDQIPYGIRYMLQVIKTSLETKFPAVPLKDILKVVGNVLYYRYINSAIVAPDAFGVIDVEVHHSLSVEQRINLGSIAKILQFASCKTGFSDESPHLICMNSFIVKYHEQFKEFFKAACDVPELDDYFEVDEYTEVSMLTKPSVYVSLQDICEIHLLLLENQDFLSNGSDPLQDLLEDLPDVPSIKALLGGSLENVSAAQLEKTEVCLTLTNKFEVTGDSKDHVKQLFIKTKQMITDVMHCIGDAESIPEMLAVTPDEKESNRYQMLLVERSNQNVCDKEQAVIYRISLDKFNESETLKDVLKRIAYNLNVLELHGFVSSKNSYQAIVNTIALEILNRRRYRTVRRRDFVHLKTALCKLKTKTLFYEEQADYYNHYLKKCLDSMSVSNSTSEKKMKSKITRKYSAAKLHEKGVIISMEGLSKNQFKNVIFEISPKDESGVFSANVKFMGTKLFDVELDIQELLELQFEGVSVTKMFDQARVNVNLLLFLLTSEFYGKQN